MADFDPVSYMMGQKAAGGGGGGGGSSTLSGLTDVDISNPTDGQTLVYDATAQKWVNGSGGGGGVLVLSFDADTFLLDKTWQDIYDALAVGIPVFIKMIANNDWASVTIVHRASNDNGTYDVYANLDNTNVFATSDTADGYPEVID